MSAATALAARVRRLGRWLSGADLPPADQQRIAAYAIAAHITGGDPIATALLADRILVDRILATLPTVRTTVDQPDQPDQPARDDDYRAWREDR